MERSTFAVEAVIERDHWWFHGRRVLFTRLLHKYAIPPSARTLDVGTSTGTNLRMLRDLGFSDVTGVDLNPAAKLYCEEKGLGHVEVADAQALPFEDASFDLVLATDIIEHIPDDSRAVGELVRVLAPKGLLIIAVPTFIALWGPQDRLAHHLRRYRLSQVLGLMSGRPVEVRQAFYFNYLLFVPIFVARQILNWLRPNIGSENEINSPLINRLLKAIFLADVRSAPTLKPPFGVSAAVVATKREVLHL